MNKKLNLLSAYGTYKEKAKKNSVTLEITRQSETVKRQSGDCQGNVNGCETAFRTFLGYN